MRAVLPYRFFGMCLLLGLVACGDHTTTQTNIIDSTVAFGDGSSITVSTEVADSSDFDECRSVCEGNPSDGITDAECMQLCLGGIPYELYESE